MPKTGCIKKGRMGSSQTARRRIGWEKKCLEWRWAWNFFLVGEEKRERLDPSLFTFTRTGAAKQQRVRNNQTTPQQHPLKLQKEGEGPRLCESRKGPEWKEFENPTRYLLHDWSKEGRPIRIKARDLEGVSKKKIIRSWNGSSHVKGRLPGGKIRGVGNTELYSIS